MATAFIFLGLAVIGLGLCISPRGGWANRDYIPDFEYPDEEEED